MAGETERGTRRRGKEGREEGRHRPRRENTARAAKNQGKINGARNPGQADGPALTRLQAGRQAEAGQTYGFSAPW